MKLLDYQLQSNVARLLSRENITVTHENIPTAAFDLRNRVMKLPLWKDHGKVVYDMLIAHEVGHAIFDDYPLVHKYLLDNGFPGVPDGLNVIDDIRIERRVQEKYPGLPKIFLAAYRTLVESDIFKLKDRDISKMRFLDRLNLHAKIGTIVSIPLDDDELDFYNRCYAAETTQDVIDLFEEFRERPKDDQRDEPEPEGDEPSNDENSSDDDGSDDKSYESDQFSDLDEETDSDNSLGDDSSDSTEGEEESGSTSSTDEFEKTDVSSEDEEQSTGTSTGPVADDQEISETLKDFNENISENFDTKDPYEYSAAEKTPTLFPLRSTVKKITNSYEDVMKSRTLTTHWPVHRKSPQFISDFADYKKKVKKKVGVLIREFERRKAAFRYSRAEEARVGTIDVNSLHKYRYDDQIFNSVTRLADGKNHGMIFYIDYSGSMANVLKDVIDQTLNLVYFCKKMSIPFEVYGYTSRHTFDRDEIKDVSADTEINLDSCVLNHLMSSDMSKTEFETAFEQLYFQHREINGHWCSALSHFEQMGGTPLNDVIMIANHHCNDFQKKHRVDKLNVIILSDGDSQRSSSKRKTSGITSFEGKKINLHPRGRHYYGDRNHYTFSDPQQETLLALLRKKATVIGMYLPSSLKDGKRKISLAEDSAEKFRKDYSKNKFVNLSNVGGYDSLMILPHNLEIRDVGDIDFSEKDIAGDRKAQARLAKQFAKSHSESKKSRVILTKFAELIA